MPRIPLTLLVLAFTAAAAPSLAAACEPTTSSPHFCTSSIAVPCLPGDVAGAYYLISDCPFVGPGSCMWSIWVYEETNGIEGLQRADEVVDDTCSGAIPGDRIVF